MTDEDFPSREQEAVIARLALEHTTVRVSRVDDHPTIARVQPDGYGDGLYIDENGRDVTEQYAPAATVAIDVPIDLAARLLGNERVAEALAETPSSKPSRRFALGMLLDHELVAAIDLLAPRAEA